MTTLFEKYDPQAFRQGIAHNHGYSFTFGTDDPGALNIANPDHLLAGYRYDLTVLKRVPMPAQASAQMQTLYHASTLVDHLWIQHDPGTNEIIGSWPGQ